MTWSEAITEATSRLKKAGVEDAARNAEYLALHACHLWHRSELRPLLTQPVADEQAYFDLVLRREHREPLQYIVGEWEFYGLRLRCTPAALIPRPETEFVVEEALQIARSFDHPNIIDCGTGTGAIALALASQLPNAEIIGVDLSPEAIQLATQNQHQLGIAQVTWRVHDIMSNPEPLALGACDIVVSNPPYVAIEELPELAPELSFEPRIALTDGGSGLTFYKQLLSFAHQMRSGSWFVLELGHGVARAVEHFATDSGCDVKKIVNDLAGIERALVAQVR